MNNGLYPLDSDSMYLLSSQSLPLSTLTRLLLFLQVYKTPNNRLPSALSRSGISCNTQQTTAQSLKEHQPFREPPKTLKPPPPHNMGKSSTKGNGKNKAIKHQLDRPVQVKKPSKAELRPKEEKKVYTGPQTRSRTQAAIEAKLEQEEKISRIPGAFPAHFTCEGSSNTDDPWW